MHIAYRNVNYALPDLTDILCTDGVEDISRNGAVRTITGPVTLTTLRPRERVLLCPVRRANPFLFLLDGLSVLSGVDFVKPLADIAPRFKSYSDDGLRLRGHYGKRLRPQIRTAIQMFREQRESRRVVLQIWDRGFDLGAESRDLPCNVMVIPRIVKTGAGFALDLTVVNRSNDLFWGMLGANIVQFSFLQEFLAAELGVDVGSLHQFSTNLHMYTEMGPGRSAAHTTFSHGADEYPPIVPLDTSHLLNDLDILFLELAGDNPPRDIEEFPFTRNTFLLNVVHPMLASWHARSSAPLKEYPDCDWFHAARMWWRD